MMDKKIHLNKILENINHADFLHVKKYQIFHIHYILKYLITLNFTLY